MVSDCQLELKAWIRDVFDIQGERMTSALTVLCLFNAIPGVLGQEWGERSTWKLDYDHLPEKNTPQKHSSWVQEPWAHSCFLFIQHPAVGSHLELVWDKIKRTTTVGHRVVLLIEDPATRALEKNTRHTLLRLHGVCRAPAHFPLGTILNTSRHQRNDPPELMTAKGHFWSVRLQCVRAVPKTQDSKNSLELKDSSRVTVVFQRTFHIH